MAKRITDDVQKKAMLLHYAGEEVFDLGESFVFRQAAQLADETLDKCNARLRRIARNCNFHDVDRKVRSQIIQKCQNSKVRDNGLSEPSISLADLIKYGRTLEATHAQGQAMVGNGGVGE